MKLKERTGTVDSYKDEYTILGKTLFSKDSAIEKFAGLTVCYSLCYGYFWLIEAFIYIVGC